MSLFAFLQLGQRGQVSCSLRILFLTLQQENIIAMFETSQKKKTLDFFSFYKCLKLNFYLLSIVVIVWYESKERKLKQDCTIRGRG